ncbi:MAG: hypothetical protein LIO76_05695, partial [Clostridiales bacterium]|nr:hypothetical protein [Clostridiales bacterium]
MSRQQERNKKRQRKYWINKKPRERFLVLAMIMVMISVSVGGVLADVFTGNYYVEASDVKEEEIEERNPSDSEGESETESE